MAEDVIYGMMEEISYTNAGIPLTSVANKIDELGEMYDFLCDLETEKRSGLRYLISDLFEMAQDVADLDTDMGDLSFNHVFEAHQNEIKKIKTRIMNFGGDEKNVGGEDEDEDELVVVGLEGDVHKLLDKVILKESCIYNAWYIKGMIGIGKTALARQVYNHKDVVSRFEHRGWVSFCSDMSYKEVLVELIQQMVVGKEELIGRDYLLEEMDNRSLRQMLRQHLQGKRIFIVFDDLSKGINLSYILRDLLHDADKGSRIVCTSRYDGEYSGNYYTHNVKPLNSDNSWQLFLKTIDKLTSDENKFTKELERKGKEMLKKCGGLPLAIIDVARQKAKQRLSGVKWEELFDTIDLSKSVKLLEPMYHKLDEELKPCFLYMSFFKENAIMREEKLEHIWAASGLDTHRKGFLGEGPCAGLVKESIIEVVHEFPFELEVKKCSMNPVLHMLAIKRAEEELGFEILRSNGNNQPSLKPRHRVIHCGREIFNHSTNQDRHLASLIFHGGGRYLDDVSSSYWESFELLKILDMEDFGVKTLPENIGILSGLMYLRLRNNYIQEIPRSLEGLKRLDVLDIALNFMVEVPDIIKEMCSLCHLYMSDVIFRKPLKIDSLKDLKTLACISIHDWTYEGSNLETMTTLRKLGIEEVDENSDVGKLFSSLAKLGNLRDLILRGFRFRSMPCLDEIGVLDRLDTIKLDGVLSKLPSADNFPYIKYMALVNTCLDEDPMPILEKLPCLRRLKLQNAYTGREMVISDRGFFRLEMLHMKELWNLRKVQVGEDAMWSLGQLNINCPHVETLPEELMKKLNKFKMVTTKRIATKIRNSGLTSNIMEVDITP